MSEEVHGLPRLGVAHCKRMRAPGEELSAGGRVGEMGEERGWQRGCQQSSTCAGQSRGRGYGRKRQGAMAASRPLYSLQLANEPAWPRCGLEGFRARPSAFNSRKNSLRLLCWSVVSSGEPESRWLWARCERVALV